jgi:Cu2+-exporting ATPase
MNALVSGQTNSQDQISSDEVGDHSSSAPLQGPGSTTPRSDSQQLLFSVAHSIPGRLRLRIENAFRDFRRVVSSLDALIDLPGVHSVRVNAWCAAVVIVYDPTVLESETLLEFLENVRLQQGDATLRPTRLKTVTATPIVRLLNSTFLFIESVTPASLQLALGVAAIACPLLGAPLAFSQAIVVASTVPLACRAARTLMINRKLGIDALDSTAAWLMIASGKLPEAGFMTALIALGELIRERTARQCEKLVTDLLGLSGRSAWLIRGKKRICVPAETVNVGDVVVVYPGDMVPVDGTVIQGDASVDQSALTGESMPVELKLGDTAYASTALVEGKVYLRCTATGSQTRAGIVLQSIEAAPMHETRIQNYASSVADKAVMPIFAAALVTFAITRDVGRLMSMLILDFITGIRIAAPTAVLASMHRAGRRGILVKNGAALEHLAGVTAIVFDKTGTLTSGEPKVEEVSRFNGRTEDEVLALAAAAEMRLQHPAARAIVKAAQQKGLNIPERAESSFSRSMGVRAVVDGHTVIVGSKSMMSTAGIEIDEARESELQATKLGESVSFVAVDGQVAGLIRYADRLRPEVASAMTKLKKLGVKKLVMATGDSQEAAGRIAAICGITEVVARAFPEDKANLVKRLKEQGHKVAVIGDGINDSPALAYADVAISLHGATDAAQQSADVVLTDDDLGRLPEAIRIARSAMSLVKQNLVVAVAPNVGGLALAAMGTLGPAGATLLNNGSAICAAVNSLRPLYSNGWSTEKQTKE